MERDKVKNIIRDTRRDVKYVIFASRKLNRDEMLKEVRYYNYEPVNIRQKPGSTVTIMSSI